EYLPNAQGEDVVAGIRTPLKIAELRDDLPELFASLSQVAERLEKHFREAQDIEFTVERGKLWMLQTRAAKPPARATVKIALERGPDGPRRGDQPRGGGHARPRDSLRRGLRGNPGRLRRRGVPGRRQDGPTGREPLHRREYGRGLRRSHPDARAGL